MRDWLINIRKSKKLSQEKLADDINISREYISMLESGDRNPSVSVAKLIGESLDFDWQKFFDIDVTNR